MKSKNLFYGNTITSAISELIQEAAETGEVIEYEFNGVTLNVASDSNADLIYREWDRGRLRKGYVINPYPSELTADQIAEDQRLIDEGEARQRASAQAYVDRMVAKRDHFESEVEGSELALIDKETWQQAVENYGAACVRYAEQWGCLMQSRMADGKTIAEIADTASHDADTEGLTGFMYGCAVSMLSQCWIHGEELRRWHNIKTQIKDEGERANANGGVLNPALLTIGG